MSIKNNNKNNNNNEKKNSEKRDEKDAGYGFKGLKGPCLKPLKI